MIKSINKTNVYSTFKLVYRRSRNLITGLPLLLHLQPHFPTIVLQYKTTLTVSFLQRVFGSSRKFIDRETVKICSIKSDPENILLAHFQLNWWTRRSAKLTYVIFIYFYFELFISKTIINQIVLN
jgi:hypothetical protein